MIKNNMMGNDVKKDIKKDNKESVVLPEVHGNVNKTRRLPFTPEQLANMVEPIDVVDIDPSIGLDRNKVYCGEIDDCEYVHHDERDDQILDPLTREAVDKQVSPKGVPKRIRGFECDRAAKLVETVKARKGKRLQEITEELEKIKRRGALLRRERCDVKEGKKLRGIGKGNHPKSLKALSKDRKNGRATRGGNGKALKFTFEEDYCGQAYQFALMSASNAQIAEAMGVSISQVETWSRDIPQFKKALHDGRTGADALVVASLFKKATGFMQKVDKIVFDNGKMQVVQIDKYFPPDSTAQIFWLRNRQEGNWQDTSKAPTMQATQFNIQIVADKG